ncbi:MAG: hypothetical protein EAZ08_08930 [Cytophagales bacterium]|nr:MAG: hypothetical protein EAZ08_08930 [Cytophagales bacterium]
MFTRCLAYFFCLSLFPCTVIAQDATDSLIRVLKQTNQDTNYVNRANDIATKLRNKECCIEPPKFENSECICKIFLAFKIKYLRDGVLSFL